MALLDNLESADAADIEWVRATTDRLAASRLLPPASWENLGISDNLIQAVRSPRTPPMGVYGAGLVEVSNESAGWLPALWVMERWTPPVHPGRQEARFQELVELVSDTDVDVDQVIVIPIPPPQEYYRKVHGDVWGTIGLPVRNRAGIHAVLTAGHVAMCVGDVVDLGKGMTGTVSFSDNRRLHKHAEIFADVAVIDLPDTWKRLVKVPQISGLGTAKPGEHVRALGTSGTAAEGGPVRGVLPQFFYDETSGSWGDVVMADAISVGGDSGALVIADDRKALGQIVSGFEDAYSIFQDIEFLLEHCGATSDL